jgi:hypothetical protein
MDKLQRQICSVAHHDIYTCNDGTPFPHRTMCYLLKSWAMMPCRLIFGLRIAYLPRRSCFMAQHRHANHNRPADVQLA